METSNENTELPGSSFALEEAGAGRGCRNKRKQVDPACCPVCSITLRQTELDLHLTNEIDKLNKLPCGTTRVNGKNIPCSSTNGGTDNNTDKKWETYQKVRLNRQNRQRTKTRKRKAEEVICPICNKEVSEDITAHVEVCLRKSESNANTDDDENIDVEAYEEYEWAGQQRIRATSLLQGGASTLGTTVTMADEDEDLNVDGDDTHVYGSPQYSECDIILPCGDAEDVALRKAVIGSDPKRLDSEHKTHEDIDDSAGDPVIDVLKGRIRELEARVGNREEVYKCLICMERYRTPVISVCCWHVHCEQCWLQTLGAKKLCPQCNMITSPADLRRIYM